MADTKKPPTFLSKYRIERMNEDVHALMNDDLSIDQLDRLATIMMLGVTFCLRRLREISETPHD